MQLKAIQTELYTPAESLLAFVLRHLENLEIEGRILCLSSKLVSLAEGQTLSKSSMAKEELIKSEADIYLGPCGYDTHLTICRGVMILSAGVDESNSPNGDYILYPKDPYSSARLLHQQLCEKLDLNNLGVILVDSHTSPMRRGVTGFALAYHGFLGVRSCRGKTDLYGRHLQNTSVNIADSLAAAAGLLMGEADESRPMVVVEASVDFSTSDQRSELAVGWEVDVYKLRPSNADKSR